MKFTIIIPIYNVEKYLEECVRSVLDQNHTNYEIILINDGSTDNSGKICDYLSDNNEKITVIHKQNEGLSEARNTGLRIAKGQYVIFLDSDDYWTGTNNLTELEKKLDLNPACELILFKRIYLFANGNLKIPNKFSSIISSNDDESDILKELILNNEFECQACLKAIEKEFLINNDLFFKKGIKSEDIEWFLRVIQKAKHYSLFDNPFYIYRAQREGSITSHVTKEHLIDLLNIIEDNKRFIDSADEKSVVFKKFYRSFLLYQLSITIGLFYSYRTDTGILRRIENLRDLFLHTETNKTRIIKILYDTLGLKLTSRILHKYIVLKKHGLFY